MRKKKENGKPQKKKMNGFVKFLLILVAVLLVAAGGVYAVFHHLYGKMERDVGMSDQELYDAIQAWKDSEAARLEQEQEQEPEQPEEGVSTATAEEVDAIQEELKAAAEANSEDKVTDKDVWNIMLIGTDARDSSTKSRSDSMILLSINKNTKEITLTSFMRDIYTYIPKAGYYNRLNVPNAIGGPAFLIDTIENVFGVGIDNYVYVNFFSFIDVVDVLGGVDVEVTAREIEEINGGVREHNQLRGIPKDTDTLKTSQAGLLHLNGNQALAYCRIRHIGGDTQRTERQRTVLTALINEAKSASVTELYDLVNVILPMVTTDLTETDCLALAAKAPDYIGYEIQTLRIPADGAYYGTMIDGMSVLKIDFEAAKKLLKEEIYGITE